MSIQSISRLGLVAISIVHFIMASVYAENDPCRSSLGAFTLQRIPTKAFTAKVPGSGMERTFLIYSDHEVIAVDNRGTTQVLNSVSAQTPRQQFVTKADRTGRFVAIDVSSTDKGLIDRPFGFGLQLYRQTVAGAEKVNLHTRFDRANSHRIRYQFTDFAGSFAFSPRSDYLAVAVDYKIIEPGGDYVSQPALQIFSLKPGAEEADPQTLVIVPQKDIQLERVINPSFLGNGDLVSFEILTSDGEKIWTFWRIDFRDSETSEETIRRHSF